MTGSKDSKKGADPNARLERHSGTGEPIHGKDKKGGSGSANWGKAGQDDLADVTDVAHEAELLNPPIQSNVRTAPAGSQ